MHSHLLPLTEETPCTSVPQTEETPEGHIKPKPAPVRMRRRVSVTSLECVFRLQGISNECLEPNELFCLHINVLLLPKSLVFKYKYLSIS